MKNLKSFGEINEDHKPTKFTKSAVGMVKVGKDAGGADVKIKKADWDAVLIKINAMTPAKRSEIIKKLHQMQLI